MHQFSYPPHHNDCPAVLPPHYCTRLVGTFNAQKVFCGQQIELSFIHQVEPLCCYITALSCGCAVATSNRIQFTCTTVYWWQCRCEQSVAWLLFIF